MDPDANPYGPGAGTPPPELAGRQELLTEARSACVRIKRGLPNKSIIVVGLRGVGKTVLLNRFDEIARDLEYLTVFVEHTEEKSLPHLLVPKLRELLYSLDRIGALSAAVKRSFRILKSFTGSVKLTLPGDFELGLDVDPELGTGDSGDLETDLTAVFVSVAEAAQDRGRAVALIIDELQYLERGEFSALIMAVHKINQRKLPLLAFGAGLPQIIGLAGRSKSYAERLFDFPAVGALSETDARLALSEPARREGVTFAADALSEIVRVTEGYPYFIQEWGYQAWRQAATSPIAIADIRVATTKATAVLDQSFFRVRFDRLAPSEKRYLRAMAELGAGPHRSGDIAARYGKTVMSAGPVRSKLIAKGMIFSPSHGDNEFTVPLFDRYLKRVMPELE